MIRNVKGNSRLEGRLLEELSGDTVAYEVVLLGGSIGENRPTSPMDLIGKSTRLPEDSLMSAIDAKAKSVRMNKLLSPGEKKYYKLRYVAAEVDLASMTFTGVILK